jgi:phage tail-like protein
MRDRIQWTRCAFEHTALIDATVTLAPRQLGDSTHCQATPFTGGFAGLAFDRHCRVFHPQLEGKTIEYAIWGKQNPVSIIRQHRAHAFNISGAESESGDFGSDAPLPKCALALACDETDYLYIADPDTSALWLIDTWQHEVSRQITTVGKPLDLAYAGGNVYVLLDTPGWLRVSPCDPPQPLQWPAGLDAAERMDVTTDGQAFVLLNAGTATAEIISLEDITVRLPVPFCTDFLIGPQDAEFGWLIVLARRPGEDFVRRRLKGRHFSPLSGLKAPQYDGRGIALAPDGRIAYWTEVGLRHAAPAPVRYEEHGLVYGFALDSHNDQNDWGTISLEACIPEGTQIRLQCLTRDDLDYSDPLPRTPPAGETLTKIPLPGETPLPSLADWKITLPEETPLPSPADGNHASPLAQPVFRDPSQRRPLSPAIENGFARYEAPVIANPGRFLWLVIELRGTRSKTPRLRAARVEYPAHQLVRQLPRTLWREPAARDFLTRYMAPMAAMLTEWGNISDERHKLLNPRIAPATALEWLGSVLGLSMDQCWSERARRKMLEEVSQLFRIRGTPRSLQRMLEILTGARVIIVEKFRLRGGGVVGNPETSQSSSVLGNGFRVGGSIGKDENTELTLREDETFDIFAHRFSVTLVATLSAEQMNCVRRLIETHKPAHTSFDVCTVEVGTRVGVGLHIGISSAIGKSSGFELLTLGESVLGNGYVLGHPELERGPAIGSCMGPA